MKVLDQKQINQKVKRLAYEILEHNFKEKELIFVGINTRGTQFAEMLINELSNLTTIKLSKTRLQISPAAPLESDIVLDKPIHEFKNKAIIIVDDVANTGRTIYYAFKPLLEILPKKVEVAVLIDRKHKSFPVKVDYRGLTLATTFDENIDVQLEQKEKQAVYLT